MSNTTANASIPTIIIGCGGSGLASIRKLNRLCAANPALAERIGEELFYVAIDTDKKPLAEFSEDIVKDMNGHSAPFIAEIQLSRGIRQLKQITDKCVKGRVDSPALDRIKEHMWFRRGKPFEAPGVQNLMTGAGQCPPASYCLAWFRMAEIEKQLQIVIDKVKSNFGKQIISDENPIANVNVFVVAGLAGGTGRGIWELVAYKVREIFEKGYGVPVQPIGVFFTEGVFGDVKMLKPQQIPALKVNSLTGLSELVCLMKTGRSENDAEIFRMRMPNMRTPERELTDVLGIDNTLAARTSPVHSAYLVCGDRDDGILDSSEQFYEMAGGALYSMIANSNIQSAACNDDDPFLSFASNTFEVDVTHLRSYFENSARCVAIDQLMKNESNEDGAVNSFLSKNRLLAPVISFGSVMGDKKGTLLQRTVSYLIEDAYGDRLRQLIGKLPTMLPKKGMEAVTKILKSAVNDAAIEAAFQKAVNSFGDIDALIDGAVYDAYKGDSNVPSIGRAKAFAISLRNRFEEILKKIPVSCPVIKAEAAQIDERLRDSFEYVMTQVKAASKRTWVEAFGRKPYFLPSEVDDLVVVDKDSGEFGGDVVRGIIAANYIKIHAIIKNNFGADGEKNGKGWLKHLNAIIAGYDKLEEFLGVEKARLQVASLATTGGSENETEAFDLLFVSPEKILDRLPSDNDHESFYKRTLVPVMTKEEVDKLAVRALKTRDGLDEFIQEAVKNVANISSRDSFLRKLDVAIKGNVYIADGFLEKNFSFTKVLSRNIDYWNKTLVALSGDKTTLAKFRKTLRNYLGVESEYDSQLEVYHLPSVENILTHIVAMLSDDCKPWWKIVSAGDVDNDDAGNVSTTVLLTERYGHCGYPKKADLEKKVSEILGGRVVETHDLQTACGGASPFSVIAYANQILLSQDFGDVISFDYTLSDAKYKPIVDHWLQNAERKDGESIFSTADRNKGCGYISPIFVNNPVLAAARWHPWLKGDFGTVEDEDAAFKALLYAFLGNGTCEEISKLEKVGWKFPLIKIGPRQQFMIARKALKWDGEKASEDPNCAWLVDEKICVSLANLHEYLNGNGKTGLNGKLVEKDVAEGKALRRGIGDEESIFMTQLIKGKFGPEFYTNLCAARDKWFAAQRDAAKRGKNGRKEDAEIWQKLIKLSGRLAKA